MGETTWKKRFETTNDPRTKNNEKDSVYDDILRMQEKINNINNRRSAREHKIENYKNIELLQNIYQKISKMGDGDEEDDEEYIYGDGIDGYSNLEDVYDDEDTRDEDTDEDDTDEEDIRENEKMVEGMKTKKKKKKKTKPSPSPAPAPAPTSTTTPTPTPVGSVGGKKKNMEIKNFDDLKRVVAEGFATVSLFINQFLFYMPNQIDDALNKGTTYFARTYSEKNASPNQIKKDANIVKQFIYQLVAFIVAIWVAFNWFFIMVFKQGGVETCAETVDNQGRCTVPNDEHRFKISFDNTGKFRPILEFFFGFAVTPLATFDKYVLGDMYGKKLFSYVPWRIISHFVLLVGSFLFVYFYNFFTLVKDAVEGRMRTLRIFAIITISVLYIYKVWQGLTSGDLQGTLLKTVSPITWMFMEFIYFVILLGIGAFSINVSVIITMLFFWIISIFAIPYYQGGSLWATLQKMNMYIAEDFDKKEEEFYDVGIFQKILRMMARGLHKNMYHVGFILLMVSNLISMNASLASIQLRQIMSAVIVPLIAAVASFIWGNMETAKQAMPHVAEDIYDNLKNAVNTS